ncbi:MAG: pyridoxal phosphate-dependent aminotransferase [Armatimonadetes bacterium]|nr:pyridoxal phosphate-dependent aminotransferase [Armatimonadota bacterium]
MQAIKPSPTLAITAKAKAMSANGIDVISFGAGEPDFDTPSEICDAAIHAIQSGDTRYGPSAGSPALRQAISEKFYRENKLKYDPAQIVVSCGAKHSIYNALQVLVNPGDEVILIAPYWMTYADQILLAGGTPVVVQTNAENQFRPTLEQLEAAVSSNTKAIIINSPSNPTGAILERDDLKTIAALALKRGFWIITDEIYERLTYDGKQHQSIAALSQDVYNQTITVAGCSKTFAMTGWRIGYIGAPEFIAKAIGMLQDQVTSNPTSFAQAGAIAALKMQDEKVVAMREEFQRRRDLIVKLINEVPNLSVNVPSGAFYAFVDVQKSLLPGQTDVELASTILEHAHVATVPGSVFMAPGFIRMSYATNQTLIAEGVERIKNFLAKQA